MCAPVSALPSPKPFLVFVAPSSLHLIQHGKCVALAVHFLPRLTGHFASKHEKMKPYLPPTAQVVGGALVCLFCLSLRFCSPCFYVTKERNTHRWGHPSGESFVLPTVKVLSSDPTIHIRPATLDFSSPLSVSVGLWLLGLGLGTLHEDVAAACMPHPSKLPFPRR